MSVPKHKRTEHSYEYIANAREIKKLLLIIIHRLDNTENVVEIFYREKLLSYSLQLTYYIRIAHDIYIKTDLDFKIRRIHQTKAIALTNLMMEEITFLIYLFPKYIKTFENILEKLNKEVILLKGWRKSTDKVIDKFKTEYII